MTTAIAYYRTSSAANVGEDKDSRRRQEEACASYAAANGLKIVGAYYDAAVKGTDPVMQRPGFSDMFDYMMGNGARIILVENASRFSRDIVVQITGYEFLKKHGISIIPVDAPNHFIEDTATSEMIRGILAVISQFEKKTLVDKLAKARQRKRATTGRCEGRKPPAPEAITLAKNLRAKGLSYKAIGATLYSAGFSVMDKNGVTGIPYKAESVKRMVIR